MKMVSAVDCVPLDLLMRKAHVKHVNLFVLDVEVRDYNVVDLPCFSVNRLFIC